MGPGVANARYLGGFRGHHTDLRHLEIEVRNHHLQVVLRVRPDLARERTDDEVALRWRLLFPPRDEATGRPGEPEQHDVNMIAWDPERVAELRGRLASLWWFMRCLNEPIARASDQDGRSSLRSISRSWIGRGASCGRGVAGRFQASFRRSWTDWAGTASAGWRRCGTLAVDSNGLRAVANRWRPPRCAAVVAVSRANAPRKLLFSDCTLDVSD
jgi:hypothetical protein